MPALILGPMLRYVGESEATVWVEVDSACEVEVLGRTAPTFEVEALVYMTDLAPATRHPYTVRIDGECVWPEPESPFPPCVIQTFDKDATLRIAFGSCRVSMPHEPPYTLTHAKDDKHGFEMDALRALAMRMRGQAPGELPHALPMIGDQLYADEVSPPVVDPHPARHQPTTGLFTPAKPSRSTRPADHASRLVALGECVDAGSHEWPASRGPT